MATGRSELKAELRRALHDGEIVPYFQPQVDIRNSTLLGFEVLARWLHPTRGSVHPDEFIPAAEQAGVIGELTESILLQAFTAMSSVRSDLRLSVNISPVQLRDTWLPRQISCAAKSAKFPLNQLTIEITESALVDNLELAASIATNLKVLGVKLSLDDFGTGYSSLRNLQALPFDELKVDRSFVSSMTRCRDSRKIVAAVIGLGQSLKLSTVAEGIENCEQADILQRLGCDVGQGWLYGPPVSMQDLPALIAAPLPVPGHSRSKTSASDLLSCIEPLPSQRFAQLQAIYDGAPVGLAFIDADLKFISINSRLARLNQLSVEAHLGRKLSEILHPAVYTKIEPYIERALKGESIAGLEIRTPAALRKKKEFTFLASYQPVRDEAGEVIGISIALVDITERKQMEDALQESENHSRHMLDLNPQIPWIMAPDGRIIEASPHWQEFTGQTPEQTLNYGWKDALHPDDLARIMPILEASFQSGDSFDLEFRIRTKEEEWRWVRARGNARRDAEGNILRWYGCSEDIHEHVKLKQALHEAEMKIAALLEEKQFLDSRTVDPSSPTFVQA